MFHFSDRSSDRSCKCNYIHLLHLRILMFTSSCRVRKQELVPAISQFIQEIPRKLHNSSRLSQSHGYIPDFCVHRTFHWVRLQVGLIFAFRTALILRGLDSTKCRKLSSAVLIHIDVIASRGCCGFVGCTSIMWLSATSRGRSVSCSRNVWDLWHGALPCWK